MQLYGKFSLNIQNNERTTIKNLNSNIKSKRALTRHVQQYTHEARIIDQIRNYEKLKVLEMLHVNKNSKQFYYSAGPSLALKYYY